MHRFQLVDAVQLARAYASACYAADAGGGVHPVRVGDAAAGLESAWPAPCYAFITAWNPVSVPRGETENRSADAQLRARLAEAGAQRLPMRAEDAGGCWAEPGWLVGGLDAAKVDALAREFGQAGVLFWEASRPVRLRMLLTPPRNAPELPFVDWVE
ncbi:MAG TPA: DUF3293 domain-containing protein [Lysobacter sp.]